MQVPPTAWAISVLDGSAGETGPSCLTSNSVRVSTSSQDGHGLLQLGRVARDHQRIGAGQPGCGPDLEPGQEAPCRVPA